MSARKTITLGELFTDAELQRARRIVREHDEARRIGGLVDKLQQEVVEPALVRINTVTGQSINTVTGQSNDARYWAYALEYAIRNGGVR